MPAAPGAASAPAPSFAAACRVWLTFGLASFGGAAAQIALLHRLVVAERRWVGEERFALGLAVALLLPGPEAHKLATWLGFCLHGVAGAMAAGTLFILPGAVAIAALAALYAAHAEAPALSILFFGLRGAVLAILAQAVVVLSRRAIQGRIALAVAASAFAAAFFLRLSAPLIVLAAACFGFVYGKLGTRGAGHTAPFPVVAPPGRARVVAAALALMLLWGLAIAGAGALGEVAGAIGRFFATVSVLAFGGAYAILAWVAEEAVARRGWVTAAELIDGLALAETTPGPTILVLQFLAVLAAAREGGLAHGTALGFLAVVLLFLPSFGLLLLVVPVADRLAASARAKAALAGISAAAVGLIASLGTIFAVSVLFRDVAWLPVGALRLPLPGAPDWAALAVAGVGFVALFVLRLGVLGTLGTCAAMGMVIRALTP